MSDPTAAKRLHAEARTTCGTLEDASKKLLRWADQHTADDVFGGVTAAELRALGLALAHQGGRLDMAAQMAHARRKRK